MAIELYQPLPSPIRGVLFDMDGLVLDTEKLFCRFWQEAAQDFGLSMTWEQALGMRALSRELGNAQIRKYFGPEADYLAIRSRRIALMEAYILEHGTELKPGIRELLDFLDSRGIRAAITSSSPTERIRRYLSFHGLDRRFAALCSGHQVARGKPEPDIYLFGAQSLALPPAQCLALEDAPSGLLAAHRAGCVTVMIPDLDQPGDDTRKLLHARADSLLDIITLLQR